MMVMMMVMTMMMMIGMTMMMVTSAIRSSMVASISFPSLCRPWWHFRSHRYHCCRHLCHVVVVSIAIVKIYIKRH